MKKFLNFLKSLLGLGRRTEMPQLVSVETFLVPERQVPVRVRPLTCAPIKPEGKKVRFVTRRGHQMVAEIVDRNGGGEVFLRRPHHRFGPTFRRVLVE
ncbi:MAG: hypothetical protein WC673_00730 [Candidatus Paceibacterota bacterium]|jgi:hypothetical protein